MKWFKQSAYNPMRPISPDNQFNYIGNIPEDPQTPEDAYMWAEELNHGRYPEGEELIATDAHFAYLYAVYILKGRFFAGEDKISEEPNWSYFYAENVVQARWPEGERAISKDPRFSYWYARDVVGGRWEEGEQAIYSSGIKALIEDYNRFIGKK